MENSFPLRRIGEAAEVYSGYAFKSRDFGDDGIPVVKIKNVNNRVVDLSDTQCFSESKVTSRHDKFFLRNNDVLIAMTGQGSVGRVGRLSLKDNEVALLNQRVGRFVTDEARLDLGYLFYVISSDQYERILFDAGSGSGQPNLSPDLIHSIEIPFPTIEEQRAIAHVLGTLDNKIELNWRMNDTLEGMARALFKSWFVDFDPVRAKMDGRPTGLPPELDALFPDALVESALGEIPVGWEVAPLDEIANYQNGLALQKYPAEEGEDFLYRLKIRELRQGYFDDSSERSGPDIREECIVYDGDVIFSWSGSLLIDLWTGGTGALNQHLFKVTSDRFPRWFYYLWTSHHLEAFQQIAADKATTMGHIKRHHLNEALVVLPTMPVLATAGQQIEPLIRRLVASRLESRSMSQQRDALLPRLISGQLRVGVRV